MFRRIRHVCAVALAGWLLLSAGQAQSPVQYVYDELGRLVAVVAPNGESAVYAYDSVGNLLSITRQTTGAVSILAFTPDAGPPGATVRIYGTGFSTTANQNSVSFNGTSATVVSSTATSIVTTVPSGASTGTIAVTTPTGSATSTGAFAVGASTAPTITSFTPTIGGAGTSISVSGTNFESTLLHNRLALNLTRGWPTAGTSTSLTTSLPANAGSGRISVITPAGSAVSAADFFVPPSPYVPADVLTSARMAIGDTYGANVGTSNKIALVIFDGSTGQRVSLKVVPGPLSTVRIHQHDLSVISEAGIGVLTALLEPPLLTRTGTYSIVVDPTGTATGTTTLTLYNVPADFTGTITAGDANATGVQVPTTVPGQNGRLTFSAAANDRVAVAISSGPGGSVAIRKPDESTHASGNIGVLASFIDTTVLPVSGTYSLFVDYTGINTGTVTLTLYAVPADFVDSVTPSQAGAAKSVPLTVPGQNGHVTFSGTANQRISVKVSSASPTGTVSLRKPDGSSQASVSSGFVATFMDTQVLASSGTSTLKVDPANAAYGTTTLTVYDVPADTQGTVTIGGGAVAVSPGTPGQNGSLTFSGTQSQNITVRLTSNTIGTGGIRGVTTVRLLKPDGSQLASVASSASSFNMASQTLPTTGTYTIVVDPSGTDTGSINVQVTNP
jgi:YD repeat-containing protein